jgi:hypothetical protein
MIVSDVYLPDTALVVLANSVGYRRTVRASQSSSSRRRSSLAIRLLKHPVKLLGEVAW